eukprot:1011275_1
MLLCLDRIFVVIFKCSITKKGRYNAPNTSKSKQVLKGLFVHSPCGGNCVKGKQIGDGEKPPSIFATPTSFDEGQRHHYEDGASKCHVYEKKITGRRMELRTSEPVEPVVQIDRTCQSTFIILSVAERVELDVVGYLGKVPCGKKKEEKDEDFTSCHSSESLVVEMRILTASEGCVLVGRNRLVHDEGDE